MKCVQVAFALCHTKMKGTNTGGNISTAIPAQPHMEQCAPQGAAPGKAQLQHCKDGLEQREQNALAHV